MISGIYYRGRADNLARLPANPSSAGAVDPQDYNTYMNGYNSVGYSLTPKKLNKERMSLTEDLVSHVKELFKESFRGPADSITDVDRAILHDLETFRRVNPQVGEAAQRAYNKIQESRARHSKLSRAKQIRKESEC